MKRLAAFLLGFLLIALSGCKAESLTPPKTDYPVSVGNITLNASPQRIVSLSATLTELVCELGFPDRLVGRTDTADYPESVTALPSVGGEVTPDYDAVIGLEPDLLLTARSLPSAVMSRMSDAGIHVLVCPLPDEFEKMQDVYALLGQALIGSLNGEQTGRLAYQSVKAEIDGIKANLPIEKPRFLYLHDADGAYYTSKDYGASLLTLFGVNIGDGAADLSAAIAANPDLILLDHPYMLENLLATEQFAGMEAVQNASVYTLPEGALRCRSMRTADDLRQIAAMLYPERFALPDPAAESETE